MRYIIDEPTPFDTQRTWQQFLDEMKDSGLRSNDVVSAINRAEMFIAKTFGE